MKSLLELVQDIKADLKQSNDLRLQAAINLAKAHDLVDKKDPAAEGMTWEEFATEHFGLSWSEIKKLVSIGLSDDPEKAMEDCRDKTRKSVAKSRENKLKKKLLRRSPCKAETNEGEDSPKSNGEKGDPEPGTVDLIIHAYEAADDEAHNLFHEWLLDKYGYEVVPRDPPVTGEAMRRSPVQAARETA